MVNGAIWTIDKGWHGGTNQYHRVIIDGYALLARRPLPTYDLIVVPNFLTDDEINHVLNRARTRDLSRSETTSGITNHRTSFQTNYTYPTDTIHTRILRRIEVTFGVTSMEFGDVLRYQSGSCTIPLNDPFERLSSFHVFMPYAI